MASKATPARLLALQITSDVRKRDAYVRDLIDARRPGTDLDPQEFDYAQVLSFGVVMCQGTLDEAIDMCLSSPKDVKPKVRDALRISAYELLFLQKPAYVVVSQGVELVRKVASRAAGVANFVLRQLAEKAPDFPWGDPEKDNASFARMYGVPLWIAERFIAELGRETAASVLEADLHPAPRYLVDNPFVDGESFASDLSAQKVAALVPLDPPILEIGAGRGTKTLLIESRAQLELGHTVPIHALDLHEYRARLIQERMAACGIESVEALPGDGRDLSSVPGIFEQYPTVFVDAPCSGTGTMRRHPEIRWRLTPHDVDELSDLQLALLCEAATRVAPQGTLVYATCSILVQENQEAIKRFLFSEQSREWEIKETFQTLPSLNGPDGHFACTLKAK